MSTHVYVFDLYSRSIEKRSDTFKILIDYATRKYEATISLCNKLDGSNIYHTNLTRLEEQPNSKCRVNLLIDTQLDITTLNSIHKTLSEHYNFIYKPSTFYQTQIIYRFSSISEVFQKLSSFNLINVDYSDIFNEYTEVNRIPNTDENINRNEVLLPSTIIETDDICWLSKDIESLHYIDFSKKQHQDNIPQYSVVVYKDQFLCCKNYIPPTLIDMRIYLIPEFINYRFNSVNAYVGNFEYLFNNNVYNIWISSKYIIKNMNQIQFVKSNNFIFNTFIIDDQKILLKMFKSFINLFGLSDYNVANNNTIYYYDDDILIFFGQFPEFVDRVHTENFSAITF